MEECAVDELKRTHAQPDTRGQGEAVGAVLANRLSVRPEEEHPGKKQAGGKEV